MKSGHTLVLLVSASLVGGRALFLSLRAAAASSGGYVASISEHRSGPVLGRIAALWGLSAGLITTALLTVTC